MKQPKRRIHFRIPMEDYERIKVNFKNGLAKYFMDAVDEYSHQDRKAKQEVRNKIAEMYNEISKHLGHIGGNLNQALHHCNSLALEGKLSSEELNKNLLIVEQTKNLLESIQNKLYEITAKSLK